MSNAIAYDDNDLETLGKTIWGEARGEKPEGQIAVAWVIRNRSQRRAFTPATVSARPGAVAYVCHAAYQFSCWNSDDPNRAKMLALGSYDYVTQFDAGHDVLEGVADDPTKGADHYFASSIPAPLWAAAMTETARIGNHIFFDSSKPPRPVLAIGSRGSFVASVQGVLQSQAYLPEPPDGIFGMNTYGAVRRFQEKNKLEVDGVVGPQTYAALGV